MSVDNTSDVILKETKEEDAGGKIDQEKKSQQVTEIDEIPQEENTPTEEFDPFNTEEVVNYSSDEAEEREIAKICEVADNSIKSDKKSNLDFGSEEMPSNDEKSSKDSSSSDTDTDLDSERSSDEEEVLDIEEIDEINEDETDGPIRSKNEIFDFQVPSLPENYVIEEKTKIQFVGHLSGVVEKNVMIKSASSAEERVLNEGTIFCFEDRTPIGLLFEVFGRLQAPVYTIKFNTLDEALQWKEKKGEKIYFVVPTAEYISTTMIRKFKGTDASNFNDEELPEEEQEFSDDEKEAAAKKSKKRKKKQTKSNDNEVDEDDITNSGMNQKKTKLSSDASAAKKISNYSVKSRLISLPSKSDMTASNKTTHASTLHVSGPNTAEMVQHLMTIMQQANQMNNQFPRQSQQTQFQAGFNANYNQFPGQFNTHQYNQYSEQYFHQFHQPVNSQYPAAYNTQTQQAYQNPAQIHVNLSSNVPLQQQYGNPSPMQHAQPSLSYQDAGNTALLVAQLAEAISNNASTAASNIDEVFGNSSSEKPNDDEYDPTI